MIVDFLLFPVFVFSIVALGATFDWISTRLIGYRGRLAEDISILGFFGFFFLGILGVIANFFVPLTSPVFMLVIFTMLTIGIYRLMHQRCLVSRRELIVLTVAAVLLVPLVSKMAPGYDGGLYHLPHQLWLREERVVLGLANFHSRFGISSLLEYAYAPLWIDNQFKLLSYALGSVTVFFISFLVYRALDSDGATLALIFGVVTNLVVFSGYLVWAYTYADVPAGFMFATVFIYGVWMVYTEESLSRREWFVFSILTLSAVLIKVSSALVVVWGGFVLAHLWLRKRTSVKEVFIGISIAALIAIIWSLRSVLVSGCLLFPVKSSCIDTPWSAIAKAEEISNATTAWARHPKTGLDSLDSFDWFSSWWLPEHSGFLIDLSEAGLAVAVVYVLFSAITKFSNVTLLDVRHIAACAFIITAAVLWFWMAPTPRFGIGIFTILAPVIFLFLLGGSCGHKYKKQQRAAVIVLSILFLADIGPPWRRLSKQDLVAINGLSVPTPEIISADNFGVRPATQDKCWLVPECSPYNRPKIQQHYGFKAFLRE